MTPTARPSYIALYERGELQKRAAMLDALLKECTMCPRMCGVDRKSGEKGACGVGAATVVSSAGPHFGEETPLVGWRGSGAIFLTGCNLACIFCQNSDISQDLIGEEVTTDSLSEAMVALQKRGCHNINFVSPTHQTPQIIAALPRAVELGLEIPLVYNTGSYDSVDTLKLLEGIFDIYMPDMKYGDGAPSGLLSGVDDYATVSKAAVREMHRQVGDLTLDSRGIASRGLIIRHLVLPVNYAATGEVLAFVAGEISKNSYINLMDQFAPSYKAREYKTYPGLRRALTRGEFDGALRTAGAVGLTRLA